ncbi:sulfurtransferase complex subunit TusC [Seongchinamella sediminis]|uniref:Sulfurtransferase complex subunit TusC n=1 Tax=Seongchinamella sediminis TaxID=2283635 RepID=A0A3L7E2Q7_9GAMM|nr:sulfurtransferase complex subunit TusC [Seongchinamella sediminis]RLQ23060.1 sulfurtransferase complex subunit TusC [Seongchinamella sediminis]
MSTVEKKRSLLVMRHSPYGSSLARATIDLALAMGAFDQDFDLLFMGPGVLQLVKDQHSEQLGLKNAGKILSSLPLYDMEAVYVDATSLQRYGLAEQDLVLPVNVLDSTRLPLFLNDCNHVLSC